MTDLIKNYLAVNIICVITLIGLAFASWKNVLFIEKMRKQFALTALLAVVVIAMEIINVIFENVILSSRIPSLIANTVAFSVSPFIPIVLANAFSVKLGRVRKILSVPAWINLVLVITSPWTGLIFNVTSGVIYSRGPLFGIYIIAYLSVYVLLVIASIKATEYYQFHMRSAFILLHFFTILATSVQILVPSIHLTWLAITINLILFYANFCIFMGGQDTLTGLLNRIVYDRYVKGFGQAKKGTVIIFDMDDFKQANDRNGHQWGDYCLEVTGTLIKEIFSKIGSCYRIGGDEFCVISKVMDEEIVKTKLSQFHLKIDEIRRSVPLLVELPMVSTGYASLDNVSGGYDAVMKKADAHMYGFKNKRKQNQTVQD